MKIFIDFDKANSKISINYFLEDSKIVIKVPLKDKDNDKNDKIIMGKFDIANKIYLTHII
ncbi:MAG: hypothetical protein ACFFA6_03300 [Promethearchaeota archaeon]